MSSSLTADQQKKIEESRQRALAIRAQKQKQDSSVNVAPMQSTLTNRTPLVTPAPKSNFVVSKEKAVPQITTRINNKTGKSAAAENKFAKRGSFGTASKKENPSCVLISRQRFQVNIDYNQAAIDIFKTMNTRQYDPVSKKWSFELQEYSALVQKLSKIAVSLGTLVDPLPKNVLMAFASQLKSTEKDRVIPEANLSKVDQKLVSTLLPFQRDGINFGVWLNGRVLIADDMGLGKTLQALTIAAYYRSEWPLLIVTPSSVRFTWREQILRWLPSIDAQSIAVVTKGTDSSTSLVTIVSYDLMVRKMKDLDGKFQVIIVDECHFIKSSKSARTKAAVSLLKKAQRAILLSGTPALSRPCELFTQINAVNPKVFPHFNYYGQRYCDAKENPWGWDYSGASNLQELQLVLEECVMIRRLKKDVVRQLPSKQRQVIMLDPTSVKVDKTLTNVKSVLEQVKSKDQRSVLLEYFHQSGTAKIPAVREYVEDLIENDRKFLLFAHHHEMMEALEECIAKKRCGYIRIDGQTTAEQRNYFCRQFHNDDSIRVALLSITAASTGLNMTAASLVVFAELFWNPGILIQAEDRAHRIGQEDSVCVQYLVANNTADDYIWPLVQKKIRVLSSAGLARADFAEADITTLEEPRKNHDLYEYFESAFVETSTVPPIFPEEANAALSRVPGESADKNQPINDFASHDWLDDIDSNWDQEPIVKKPKTLTE